MPEMHIPRIACRFWRQFWSQQTALLGGATHGLEAAAGMLCLAPGSIRLRLL